MIKMECRIGRPVLWFEFDTGHEYDFVQHLADLFRAISRFDKYTRCAHFTFTKDTDALMVFNWIANSGKFMGMDIYRNDPFYDRDKCEIKVSQTVEENSTVFKIWYIDK